MPAPRSELTLDDVLRNLADPNPSSAEFWYAVDFAHKVLDTLADAGKDTT